MRSARLVVAGLLPLGVLLGHGAGYGLAGEHSHHYMTGAPLWPVACLAAGAAIGIAAWSGLQRPHPRQCPRLSLVVVVQGAVFFAQEGAEHLVRGHGFSHLMASPAFRWGLAAQAVTAAILVLASSVARATGQRLRTMSGRSCPTARPRPSASRPVVATTMSGAVLSSPASERGPPPFFVRA